MLYSNPCYAIFMQLIIICMHLLRHSISDNYVASILAKYIVLFVPSSVVDFKVKFTWLEKFARVGPTAKYILPFAIFMSYQMWDYSLYHLDVIWLSLIKRPLSKKSNVRKQSKNLPARVTSSKVSTLIHFLDSCQLCNLLKNCCF